MPPEAARTAEPGPESVNRPVRPVPPALLSPGTGPKNQTPAAPQTSTQTPNAGQEQAAQEPKPSSAVGGINHSVDQRTSHTGAEAKLNRGRAEKSQTTAAPHSRLSHPGATAGNGSGAMTLFTRSHPGGGWSAMPRQRRQGLTTHSHPGGGWPIRFTFSPAAVPLTSPERRRGWPHR